MCQYVSLDPWLEVSTSIQLETEDKFVGHYDIVHILLCFQITPFNKREKCQIVTVQLWHHFQFSESSYIGKATI